jgi:cytoskeletal protein RodZ
MTTRDEARRTRAELRADARALERASLEREPTLPARLRDARERKGVDLHRAERDTKIRARYLAALERGEYAELPGAVYTKGFLRNYALYLGLDPEDVIRQWRRERGDAVIPAEPVISVPRPLVAPRQGLTFSPAVIVAALMTVGIVLFGGYLAVQLLRFAKPPTLAVTNPATAVVEVGEDATTFVLRGTSVAGATITIEAPGRDQPYRVSADGAGRWTAEVELRRGRNQFDITALDPETGKQAETPARVFITVPFLVIEAPTLTVDSPAEGSRFENGAIPVKGASTNAARVIVRAEWVGPADNQPVASASPSASPVVPTVAPITVDVAADGSFETPLELTTGRWTVTITAESAEGKTASLVRNVSVAYEGVNLVITISNGPAWLKVWVDGALDPTIGAAGRTYRPGKTLTFTGQTSIEVRTGSSGSTFFTLNGTSLGTLGKRGVPETWLFQPPEPPVKTNRQ